MTAARLFPSTPFATLLLALIVALAAPSAAETGLPDPEEPGLSASERIERLIERIRIEQAAIETLHADFEQTRESELLQEPEMSTGELWYAIPGSVLWDFDQPSNTLVCIRDGEMLTWFRDLGRAERVDIGRQSDQVLEYLSAGGSLDTLRKYFLISASFPKDPDAPYRLELEPKFRRVAKRIAGMALELDRHGYFPVFLRYEEPGGDVTELRFSNVEINEPIPDERFAVELPAEVEVRELEFGERGGRDP